MYAGASPAPTASDAPDSFAPTQYQDAVRGERVTHRDEPLEEPDEFNFDEAPLPSAILPLPGELIGTDYRVVRELGRGAMGVVFLALDEQLQRKVAIKLIRAELLLPGFRRRFKEEARAMARVSHPNVLGIHAFGEHGGTPYFVMELVDGTTLEDWLSENSAPVDLDTALSILTDVCDGVAAIHQAGALHRDIKPSNILLDSGLRARIADFGVSVLYEGEGASAGEVVGTPAYMAPEIGFPSGKLGAPSPRSDVYSLACVAYELLTGRPPFDVESGLACMIRHATAPIPLPSKARPGLPATFDRVLLAALAKKPEERTPSVDALRRGLILAREQSLEPERILVAEDDADFRELLEIKLRQEFPDADVECTPNGRAALEALDRKSASVAILDLDMPILDGLALTALVRSRESSKNMPIIVLTASGGPDEWKRLASIGADRFIVKPVNLDDVVELIRRAIRERLSLAPAAPG